MGWVQGLRLARQIHAQTEEVLGDALRSSWVTISFPTCSTTWNHVLGNREVGVYIQLDEAPTALLQKRHVPQVGVEGVCGRRGGDQRFQPGLFTDSWTRRGTCRFYSHPTVQNKPQGGSEKRGDVRAFRGHSVSLLRVSEIQKNL